MLQVPFYHYQKIDFKVYKTRKVVEFNSMGYFYNPLNPLTLSQTTILDSYKFKDFADNNLKFD